MREAGKGSLNNLCKLLGKSRQAYYAHETTEADYARDAVEQLIIEQVRHRRKNQPKIGYLKLFYLLQGVLGHMEAFPGRDSFLHLLQKNNLTVHIRRRRHYKTTDSNHELRKYPNLIKGLKPDRPNQIWVSDITYIEADDAVCYLSLITDAYSRKIVGWAVGPTLETKYCQEALSMALSTLSENERSELIHHSDRGCQYCSYEYVRTLKDHGIRISMTQSGDPLENAIAERINGILKTEWLYGMHLKNFHQCRSELKRIIDIYNNERPHMSIGMKVPNEAHKQQGPQQQYWRNPWDRDGTRNSDKENNADLKMLPRSSIASR